MEQSSFFFLEADGHAAGQGIALFYKLHILVLCPYEPFVGLGRLQPAQPPFFRSKYFTRIYM